MSEFDAAEFLSRALTKRRSRLVVEIDLDPVPGWGNEPEDHQRMLQHYLDTAVPHYNPAVRVAADARTFADALRTVCVTVHDAEGVAEVAIKDDGRWGVPVELSEEES